MKILYDHLCFWQKYGGVPRYFIEIMKRMSSENYICTAKISNNEYLKELGVKTIPFLPKIKFRGKSRIESTIGKLVSIPIIRKGNYDIYHQTHYDTYAYKYLPKNVRTVTTIHDLNFYTVPQFYSSKGRLKDDLETSVKLADHIITISNNSKNDLINHLDCSEDKISVIHHGIDLEKFSSSISSPIIGNPYILYVGARNKYKNFDSVIKAFSVLKIKYSDLKLYCAGIAPNSSELDLLNKYNIKNDVLFFQSSDQQLIELYRNAVLFVFPSYYEGFGLPILESMAAGCPVVLSNTSCFPEIAGNAGIYFDPYDIDSMIHAIESVILNSEIRNRMIRIGKERVKTFSWEASVAKHIVVYESLI